jgi:DNA-binding NarL/FixJ family response regulator
MTPRSTDGRSMALIVYPELDTLAELQGQVKAQGYMAILARDLPMALFAITQHHFDLAIVSVDIGDRGDGWSLASVIRMLFPRCYIAVTGAQTNLQTYQTAINAGVSAVYPPAQPPSETVKAIIGDLSSFTADLEARSGHSLQ